jgi:hypothetical protein
MEYWKSIEYQFFDKLGKHFFVFPLRQRGTDYALLPILFDGGQPQTNRLGHRVSHQLSVRTRRPLAGRGRG